MSIYSDDSTLVIRIISAFRETETRLQLARAEEDILDPEVLDQLDVLIIDERMAEIDTWNVTRRVRGAIADNRPIAILALVRELDVNLLARGKELGVDAFLLMTAISNQLLERVKVVSHRVPDRTELLPGSLFLDHAAFVAMVREQIEVVEMGDLGDLSEFVDMVDTRKASGMNVTLSWKDDRSSTKRRSTTTRFRRVYSLNEEGNEPPKTKTPGGTAARQRVANLESVLGRTFGKVKLSQEIGRGGGGAVFLGRHTSLDMEVAVKVLYPDLVHRDPEFAQSFLAEARTAARIQNGAVVRMLDVDRDGDTGCYYIVMEYVKGQSLEDLIYNGTGIPEFRLIEIALQVASCLRAAEELGIVHRDIKPANILISGEDEVKVADLGLAKKMDMPKGIATGRLQKEEAPKNFEKIVGTPFYIAPEQIGGSSRFDSRLDIYSLGATLFHVATGVTPFPGDTINDLFFHHLNTPAPSIKLLKREYSEEFSKIVQKMMAKEPAGRYASCRELASVFAHHRNWLIVMGAGSKSGLVGKLRRTFRL